MSAPHSPGSRLVLTTALFFVAGAAGVSGCATTRGVRLAGDRQVGVASYYAHGHQGRRTASGERFEMGEMTAAHRTLPFGTRVRVTNLANGRWTVVRINDRGPFKGRRIIDVSYAAARELGMVGTGTARVRLEVVGRGS
ncbi:MAG: septal ring lytic transglycosylase RlpA family protein [Candidatus Eiseniibacteriota bacterium]